MEREYESNEDKDVLQETSSDSMVKNGSLDLFPESSSPWRISSWSLDLTFDEYDEDGIPKLDSDLYEVEPDEARDRNTKKKPAPSRESASQRQWPAARMRRTPGSEKRQAKKTPICPASASTRGSDFETSCIVLCGARHQGIWRGEGGTHADKRERKAAATGHQQG